MPRPVRHAYSIPYGAAFGAIRAGGARRHQGTDYHAPTGTPIYGTGNGGRVAHIGANMDRNLGLGHNITIVYPGGVQTLDAHMVARTPLAYGQTVNENTIVGYVGSTGNAVNGSPPGPHDHHQRWENGVLVNPEVHYGSAPAGGGSTPLEEPDMDATQDARLKNVEAMLTRHRPIREIISGPDGTAWYCYERLVRYAIPSERNLNTYQAHLTNLGYDASVTPKSAADLPAYGVPVFDIGNVNYGARRSDLSGLEARLLTAIGTVSTAPAEIDVEALAAAIAPHIPTGGTGPTPQEVAAAVASTLAPLIEAIPLATRAVIVRD